MVNIKKYGAKKGTAKKSAARGKTKVAETFACECCRPVVMIDDCGCVERRFLC